MPLSAVTIKAITDMARLTVFLKKVRIDFVETLRNKLLFADAGTHRLIEDRSITLMAADTPFSLSLRCRRVCQISLRPYMARRTREFGMDPFDGMQMTGFAVFCFHRPGTTEGQ